MVVISIIVYSGLGFLFASAGGFKQLAIISSASCLLIYLAVSLAVIKLRASRKPETETNLFRIRGGYTVPVLSSLVIIWFLSHLSTNELTGIGLFALLLTVMYFIINPEGIKRLINKRR